jgi:hypothetical protein
VRSLSVRVLTLCGALSVVFASAARADQRQDWILAAGDKGDYVTLDFIFGAVQAAIEHREPIYGGSNMLTVRASAIGALPFGSTQGDVELRLLNLTLGVTGGYASIWRNQSFDLGAPMHRKERREREAAGETNTDSFGFFEGRAGLAFPFNDYVVLNHVTAWRSSGATERSFDNLSNVVHDGEVIRTDLQLFFKHEDFGGLAPVFQILSFPLEDDWRTQYNYGFMLVTRAGLVQRDDLLVWQMLFHSGPVFGGGYDNRDVYGAALWRGPFTFLLVYRSVISI